MNLKSTALLVERLRKPLIGIIILLISTSLSAQFLIKNDRLPRERYILKINEKRKISRSADSIYYLPGKRLTWNDFVGRPQSNSPYAAITRSGFGMHWVDEYDGYSTIINLTVPVYFIKSKSWVKPHARKEYELAHEQLHFDITMLVAERFKASLQQKDLNSNYAQIIQQEYRTFYEQLKVMQSRYDSETNHGLIKGRQKEWEEWIEGELAQFL